jgi:sulfide dehydrogenase [flavocytochrome c] flavoprotein chain
VTPGEDDDQLAGADLIDDAGEDLAESLAEGIVSGHPDDATSGGDMPKSAFLANSQAKACAFAIAAALTGWERFGAHLFNTCFTFLAADDAVSDAMAFEPDGGAIKISDILISQVGEDAESRRRVVQAANGWYAAFTHEVFG